MTNFIVIPIHSTEVNKGKDNQHIFYLVLFSIKVHSKPFISFPFTFRVHFFLVLLMKGVTDGHTDRQTHRRTDGLTEKHGSFYNKDYKNITLASPSEKDKILFYYFELMSGIMDID